MSWTLRWHHHTLDLAKKTHVMGVLNVTPDSFSDGGQYFKREQAIAHGLEMASQGADIIDVGGESTRPYAQIVSIDEELERVIPIISTLSRELSIPISIDTYKARVAHEALKAGASLINDISAFRFDPHMASLAAEAGVPVVLMHMKGTPRDMQDSPTYDDLMGEILSFLGDAVKRAISAGIREDLIIVDPGIGFGKSFNDNLVIIRDLPRLAQLRRPVLLGSSNKAFIGHILDKAPGERDTGTMASVAAGVINGADLVRVHNVQKAVETVRMIDAIKSGNADGDRPD